MRLVTVPAPSPFGDGAGSARPGEGERRVVHGADESNGRGAQTVEEYQGQRPSQGGDGAWAGFRVADSLEAHRHSWPAVRPLTRAVSLR